MTTIVFNIDEEDITNDNYEDDISDYDSDDELDEETKNLMYNRTLKNIDDIYNIKEVVVNKEYSKKDTTNQNKKLSLSDFNKQVTEPQKFISKRVNNKKKELGMINEPTRQFNPRMPPYNLVHKKRENNNITLNLNDTDLFPSL